MNNEQLDELLKTCEQEQLHLSGMIQPFGALIALDSNSLTITHVSENINDFINFKVDNLLGKNISLLLPTWSEYFQLLDNNELNYPYIYQKIKEENLYLKISKIDGSFVIDIQLILKQNTDRSLTKNQHKLFITPDTEESYSNYLQTFIDIVTKTIGFDRIMLYQFQTDWSGKVVAETTSSDSLGSYLDLRFPASDIPKIARDLYMMNTSRIIAKTDAQNVDIITTEKDVPNLTYSDTRSVSPVHIKYLNNMGVQASFSIPIIVSDKLWGLLACHNFEDKILDPIVKNIAIEQTKLFALGVQNYLAKKKLNYMDSIQYKINDIINSIVYSPQIEEQVLKQQEEFLSLIPSDGFAMVLNNKVTTFGTLPTNSSFGLIDNRLMQNDDVCLESNSISNELFPEEQYLGPAGVLGLKSKFNDNASMRIYWFRNENIQELYWAGNPDKPVIEDAGAMKLSPRRSFEKFVEIKRGYCNEFDSLEISTGIKFFNTLNKYIEKD